MFDYQTFNQVDGKCRGIPNNDGSTFRPYKRLVPDEYCRQEENERSDKPRCRVGGKLVSVTSLFFLTNPLFLRIILLMHFKYNTRIKSASLQLMSSKKI